MLRGLGTGALGIAVVGAGVKPAQATTGITDNNSGKNQDPVGHGRG
jgi:hypothetical protein